jgi:hypothetical protein
VGDHRLEFRLLASCWYYWYLRARYAEGTAQLEFACPPRPRRARAPAGPFNALFVLHWYQGRAERASTFATQSLELRHTLPENPGLLRSTRRSQRPAPTTLSPPRTSCTSAPHSRSDFASRGVAGAMTNLADLELQQDRHPEAAAHAAEASRIFDDIGDAHAHATCLGTWRPRDSNSPTPPLLLAT